MGHTADSESFHFGGSWKDWERIHVSAVSQSDHKKWSDPLHESFKKCFHLHFAHKSGIPFEPMMTYDPLCQTTIVAH